MTLSGAAAFQIAITSGSPLTMPTTFSFSITANVSRISCAAVSTGRNGFLQESLPWGVRPVSIGCAGSQRDITSNGRHSDGGGSPTKSPFLECKCMSIIGARACAHPQGNSAQSRTA